MSAPIETDSTARTPAEECKSLRENLALLIRSRKGLTAEERAWFDQHSLHFNSDSGDVSWTPSAGEASDVAAERRCLLCALDQLMGPTEPITEAELAEAIARGQTFGDMLAELGVFDQNGAERPE
jgi:hypothetical protein